MRHHNSSSHQSLASLRAASAVLAVNVSQSHWHGWSGGAAGGGAAGGGLGSGACGGGLGSGGGEGGGGLGGGDGGG